MADPNCGKLFDFLMLACSCYGNEHTLDSGEPRASDGVAYPADVRVCEVLCMQQLKVSEA